MAKAQPKKKTQKSKAQHNKKTKAAKSSKPTVKRNHLYTIVGVLACLALIFGTYSMAQGEVLAEVNGVPIYQKEIDLQYNQIPEEYKSEVTKETLLEGAITQEVLMQEAQRLGIEATDAEVEMLLTLTLQQSGLTREAFERRYKDLGIKEDEMQELLRKRLTTQKLLEDQVVIEVTQEEIETVYNNALPTLPYETRVKASHILVETQERADEIYTLAQTQDFAALAKEHSTGPSGPNGGDLGYFTKGQMVPPFEKAAFATAINQVAKPVETQFGWHVIKVFDRQTGKPTLEQLTPQIQQQLTQERSGAAVDAYVESLQNAAQVVRK